MVKKPFVRGQGVIHIWDLCPGEDSTEAEEIFSARMSGRRSLIVIDVRANPGYFRHGNGYFRIRECCGRRSINIRSWGNQEPYPNCGLRIYTGGMDHYFKTLRVWMNAGYDVALCCIEEDWRLCHRAVLAGAAAIVLGCQVCDTDGSIVRAHFKGGSMVAHWLILAPVL